MNRKTFFKGLAIGTISLPVILRSIVGKGNAQSNNAAISSQRYDWKLVTTWPPNFPILGEACSLYAALLKQMSGGRINVRVYGGGELVPALESFDAVRNQVAEIGHGCAYYWAGKTPAAQFFASVPFGMNAQQMNAWITSGGGLQLWEELYRDFGLVPMLGGNTGVQMGGWYNREINSVADLKGLKMRIPGLGGKVLSKAGGAPVLLAGGEIYTGLERGVIDATEWLGPFHDTLMGFQDIAKYYYSPGWHEPGTALEFIFNKEVFDGLPEDLRQIVRVATSYINLFVLTEMEAQNAKALSELIKNGVEVRKFPREVLAALRAYTEEVVQKFTASDPLAQKVYGSYDNFRKKAAQYADITERIFYEQLQLS